MDAFNPNIYAMVCNKQAMTMLTSSLDKFHQSPFAIGKRQLNSEAIEELHDPREQCRMQQLCQCSARVLEYVSGLLSSALPHSAVH